MPKLGMEPIRKAQVISAVLELMADSGLTGLTLDAVAARAGVSKGVVNHYFQGKQDLMVKSFQAFLDGYTQTIALRLEHCPEAATMLLEIARIALSGPEVLVLADSGQPGPKLAPGDIGRLMIHFYGLCLVDEDFRQTYQNAYRIWLEGTATVVQYGLETGEFKALEPLPAARAFLALVDGLALQTTVGVEISGAGSAEELCRNFINSLRAERTNYPGAEPGPGTATVKGEG